jgi:hypothetical protein
MSRALALLLLLAGCVAPETKDCLDWRHYIIRDEVCTAMYGNIICVEQDVTRYYCVLWEDKDVTGINRPNHQPAGGSS